MKVYKGRRREAGRCVVTVTDDDGHTGRLRHRKRHSRGFEWGYEGSGPADLARSLVWDVLGSEPAPVLYQAVKRSTVARFQGDEWTLTEEQLVNAIGDATIGPQDRACRDAGAGVYGAAALLALRKTEARAVLLVVVDGKAGTGLSVISPKGALFALNDAAHEAAQHVQQSLAGLIEAEGEPRH